MKKFFLVMFGLLVIALLSVIAVFCYLSLQIKSGQQAVSTGQAAGDTSSGVAAEGIPLRDLPLSDSQKSVLGTIGVDVDSFVITPAMQACAAEKLGNERMAEIIAGAAPTTLETTKLLPCLGG